VTELARFHHVALTVTDLNRSVTWYTTVLGLEELFRETGDVRNASVLGFATGGFAVGLVQHAGTEPGFDPRTIGLDHVSFAVPFEEDLADWATRLDAHGVEHSGVIQVPPGAILNFKDPDGIALSIFWDR
jgi:glyoxylase I family protein